MESKTKGHNRKNKREERLGQVRTNRIGETGICIKYDNCLSIDVRLDNGEIINCKWKHFDSGLFNMQGSHLHTNLIGHHHDKLTIIGYNKTALVNKTKDIWICKCECGNTVTLSTSTFYQNKSCGCEMNKGLSGNKNPMYKHGGTHTKLFSIWTGMKKRCYQSSSNGYENYGGRGITICDEWRNDFLTFKNWADNNGYKEGLSIDRIDVNGNYEPSNCKWVSLEEQVNNKRNSVFYTYNNETHTLPQWSKILNIPLGTLTARRYHHPDWPAEKILLSKK